MMDADFDQAALERYLRDAVAHLTGPLELRRVTGGQSNPTFFLTVGNERLVLRKQPPGKLLPSAHAIDREFRVMSALGPTPARVPEMVHYCQDASVIGTPFYLMRRVEGRVFHDCSLADAPRADRRAMYRSLAENLAALHNVDPKEVGLSDYGRHEDYFQRQVNRWTRQWELSRQTEDDNIEKLIAWLPEHIPAEQALSITHGDYRVGNVIFAPDKPEVAAILDWELSTLGHPLADLAHCCIAWETAPDEYGGIRTVDRAAENLPEQSEFESWYYEKSEHGLRLEPFHMAFALFRFAVVFEGIAARASAGNANDPRAAQIAPLARNLARRGWAIAQGL
jgi:aminoglycoside phosphotransferase (APT) family kinase protein